MLLYFFFIIIVIIEVVINVIIKVIIYLGLLCSVVVVVFFCLWESFMVIIGWNWKYWKCRFVVELKWMSEFYFVFISICFGKLMIVDCFCEWGWYNFMVISDWIVFCILYFFNVLVFVKFYNIERRIWYLWYYVK